MQGAIYNVQGESFTYAATIHDLGLGDMHASDVQLLVWPSPMTNNGSIGGTLAADLLRHYDVDIDFGAHKISLFSQDHCPGKVVYWTSDNVAVVPVHIVNSGHIIVPVKLDGQPFDAVLDTGESVSVLSQEAANNTFHLGPNSPDLTKIKETGPGDAPVYRHGFRSLEIEGLSFANPEIDILELGVKQHQTPSTGSRISDANESGGNTDMLLGLRELHHLHLYIAYKEQKLYISPASEPMAATTPAAAPASAAAATH
jgi:hypothetical protein